MVCMFFFFFSSRRRHTRWTGDWSSDVCSSDLGERKTDSGDDGTTAKAAGAHMDLGRGHCVGDQEGGGNDQTFARMMAPQRKSRDRGDTLHQGQYRRSARGRVQTIVEGGNPRLEQVVDARYGMMPDFFEALVALVRRQITNAQNCMVLAREIHVRLEQRDGLVLRLAARPRLSQDSLDFRRDLFDPVGGGKSRRCHV